MAAPSKRAQLERQVWKFTPVPRFVPAGLMSDTRAGWVISAFFDHKHPEAWMAAPPDALQLDERRFEGHSPNKAVSWAWNQAQAPLPDPNLSGKASLVGLMQATRSSDVISEIRDQLYPCASRPDAEFINAYREYLGCKRIASDMREAGPTCDDWKAAIRAQGRLISDAVREQNRLLPQVLDLPAKTREGVAMKARVIGAFFADKSGLRGAAVQSLTDDIAAVPGREQS